MAFMVGIRWGAIGIAASWPFAMAINLIFSLFFVCIDSPVGVGLTLKSIFKPAIASIVMGYLLLMSYKYFTSYHVVLQIACSTLFGIAIYLIVWVLFPGGYKNISEYVSYPLSALKNKKKAMIEEVS